jgi:methylated-DNA-[protein]-cysteine S-methyltransferase
MTGKERKPTSFEERVYRLLKKVPRGKVTTYGALSEALGIKAPRAVGQALRRNPFAPQVPCHRVIRGDLTIGGFSGQTEGAKIGKKRRLLKEEGVSFDEKGKLADAGRVWRPARAR